MEEFYKLLPLFIPIFIIQIILLVIAVLDWVKRPVTRGPKWLWLVIIVFVNILGPILYFVVGRREE